VLWHQANLGPLIFAQGDGTIKRPHFQLSREPTPGPGKETPPLLSDPALIAACLEGDDSSWDALIARYQSFIYTLTLRMGVSSPDADDVFQNVCISLFQNLRELRDASRLSSWLAAVTRQEVWRLARRRRTVSLSEIGDNIEEDAISPLGAEAAPSPEEAVLRLEREHLIRQGLQHLPDPCRELLSLLYAEEPPCSYKEAADQLKTPLGSIGPRRARCLERLKKILEDFGY
jgi:RNA polymerase sigma factor (sigma-70 family)